MMTGSLVLGIYTIVKASSYGWVSGHTFVTGALALSLMGVFAIYESRLAKPILPVHILKIRSLTTSSIVRGLSFSSMFSVFFFGALYLEKVLGYAPLRTGLAFLPMTLIMAFMSLGLTSRLLMRYGPIRLLVPGTLAVIVGLLLLTRTGSTRITCSRCSHLSSSSGPA